jgi:hypothetical protein
MRTNCHYNLPSWPGTSRLIICTAGVCNYRIAYPLRSRGGVGCGSGIRLSRHTETASDSMACTPCHCRLRQLSQLQHMAGKS